MCIEYAIALGILCVIALLGIVATFKLTKLESKYDDLMDGYIRQEDLIREQWGQIDALDSFQNTLQKEEKTNMDVSCGSLQRRLLLQRLFSIAKSTCVILSIELLNWCPAIHKEYSIDSFFF